VFAPIFAEVFLIPSGEHGLRTTTQMAAIVGAHYGRPGATALVTQEKGLHPAR
jgi:hypothetical protein